ncbi:Hint domain-containing protein [uncultured Mameliella sp.]|uniref:Hint domain-containing protein n=1 Tax=uncultured Mameliella sp. TaxID=1447087 RepID=UPI002639AB4E|nr:Hint domain-containing protein [uncultured Mameliella sp.]
MAHDMVRRGSGVESQRRSPANPACNALPLGTVVLTLDGALPVEYLTPGDRIITRDSGTARLVALRPRRRRLPAVFVAPGSLGHMRPDLTLVLPAAQEVLLRDWRARALFGKDRALVPLSRLIDGQFIRSAGEIDMQLVELAFDRPHILYADGLELASATTGVTA